VSWSIREWLFTTYKGHCFYCATELDRARAIIEHTLPVRRGGETVPWNLVLACGRCNVRKGTLTLEEYRTKLILDRRRMTGQDAPLGPPDTLSFPGEFVFFAVCAQAQEKHGCGEPISIDALTDGTLGRRWLATQRAAAEYRASFPETDEVGG
jgi:hypothetical protein